MSASTKDMAVEVRFQNSADTSVDRVISVSKSWSWSTLLTEIASSINVSPEQISHLVLLNKTGSEISLYISDFAKFKRILNMYSTPAEMKFNVLFSKTAEKRKSMRLRFRLSSNNRRNLDITIPEEADWKEITELIINEFSLKEPVHHLVLINREGENVSASLDNSGSFWSVASAFNIERDGVFVVHHTEEDSSAKAKMDIWSTGIKSRSAKNSPVRPVPLPTSPSRPPPASIKTASPARGPPSEPVNAIVFPRMDSPVQNVETANSDTTHPQSKPITEALVPVEVFPAEVARVESARVESVPAEVVRVESVRVESVPAEVVPAKVARVEAVPAEVVPPEVARVESGCVEAAPAAETTSAMTGKPAMSNKGLTGAKEKKSVIATPLPEAAENNLMPTEPVMVLFCLSDDKKSTVKVVLSNFDSWTGLVNNVCTALCINAECILYFFLVDKDNDEISPFLRNAEKFWRVYNKKYSLTDGKKFVVEIDHNKMLASNSFSVLVKLSPQCEHLSPSNPVRNVSFPRDCGWAGISSALTKEFGLPNVSVHYFIVIDADGDEMSPHLGSVETFWKALSTFSRDNGDALCAHFDELAIKESLRGIERCNFLEHAARFNVSLDCDSSNKGECVVAEDASWSDIVRAIADVLALTNGSALQKIVLADADGIPISPDMNNDKKFWKIYNIKYKNTPNSFFVCTFMEASRQKAFYDLCASGTQTASLLDLIKKGVDVNAMCSEPAAGAVSCSSMEFSGLHLAAMGGHVATLRVLCSVQCIDVHRPDAHGRTPLYLACQSGTGEAVQLLVDRGATFQGQDQWGQTALHMLALHGFEVAKNHELKLREVLQNRVSIQLINAFDDTYATPLMYACKRGDHIVAKALIACGALINVRDKDGMSPLLLCIGSGNYKLLTHILQHSPNVSARNNNGDDALLLTAAFNNQRMAECLISRQTDIQTRNYIGQSLYQVASALSLTTLAQWFANQGAGKSSLSSKAQRHLYQTDQSLEKRLRQEEIKLAEEVLGAPIKVYSSAPDVAPVTTASALQNSSNAESEESDGVQRIKKTGHLRIHNLTLKTDPSDKNLAIKIDLFNACKGGEVDRAREICRINGESVDVANIVTTTGESLLHIACFIANLELCKFFHRQGVAVNVKDNRGYTPFHCACEEGMTDIATWMVSVGASCSIADDVLMTPLHYACQQQRINVIKILCTTKDCPLCAKDKSGKIALQYITRWQNVSESELSTILLDIMQSGLSDISRAVAILLPDIALIGLIPVVEFIFDSNWCHIDTRSTEDGQSAMIRACKGGKLELVKLLVRKKADISLRDFAEMTPFLHACTSGNLELVKYLASSGPKGILFDVDQNGDNGLHFCTRCHDSEMVKWLLHRGLDCNQPNFKKCAPVDLPEASDWSELKLVYREHQMIQTAPKPKDRRLLSYVDRDAMAIYDLCGTGVQDELYALIESGDNLDVELKDGSGYTALHIACERGNYSVVAMLTKNGCHFNREATSGETPLYLACKNGHMNIARLLVDLGVDIHEPVADSTLFHAAAANFHFNIMDWLSEMGVSVDVQDSAGFTAIHIAARDNAMKVVKKLFEMGAQINVNGINAPLHVACFLGNIDIAKWLAINGANPNSVHEGRNAFLIACSGGQKEVAIWLDSIGADIDCVNKEDGLTALHRACMIECVELARWLLSRNPDYIQRRAVDGKSPLSLSVLACNDELVDLCEKYLLSGTAEDVALDEIRDDIIDLLGIAIQDQDFSAAPFMLQRLMLHTDPKYIFSDGSTVLHFAAAIGDIEVLAYLLSHSAAVDARSLVGKTPLHYAAITGEVDCAAKLIDAGANCMAKDLSNRDAMQFAVYFNRRNFVKWLKRCPAYIAATSTITSSFIFSCLPVSSAENSGLVDFSDSDFEESNQHSNKNMGEDDAIMDSSIYPS